MSSQVLLQRLRESIPSLSPRSLSKLRDDYEVSRDAHTKKKKKRRLLEKALSLPGREKVAQSSAKDEYDGGDLVVGLVEGALEFALSRGFTCREVGAFLELFVTCLESVQFSENDLLIAVQAFKKEIDKYTARLSPANLVAASGYIVETVFQHFRLYHFLFSQGPSIDLNSLHLDIATPKDPQPLVDGIPATEWEQQMKIKELKEKQNVQLKQLLEECIQEATSEETKLQQAYESQLSDLRAKTTKGLTEKEISEVIDTLVQAHVSKAASNISLQLRQNELEVTQAVENLELLPPDAKSGNLPVPSGRQSKPLTPGTTSPAKSGQSRATHAGNK